MNISVEIKSPSISNATASIGDLPGRLSISCIETNDSELVFGHPDSNVTKRQTSYKTLIKEVNKVHKNCLHDESTIQKKAKAILKKTKLRFMKFTDKGHTKSPMTNQEKLMKVVSLLNRRRRDHTTDLEPLVLTLQSSDIVMGRGGLERHRTSNQLLQKHIQNFANNGFREEYNKASNYVTKTKIVSDLRKLVEMEMNKQLGRKPRFLIRTKKNEYQIASPRHIFLYFQKKLSEKRIKSQVVTLPNSIVEDRQYHIGTPARQDDHEKEKASSPPVSLPLETTVASTVAGSSDSEFSSSGYHWREYFRGWTMEDFDQLVGYQDVFDGKFDPTNGNRDDEIDSDGLLTKQVPPPSLMERFG